MMAHPSETTLSPVLFVSHGGGPMPLLGDPGHQEMLEQCQLLKDQLPQPRAILVVSAHWECHIASLTSAAKPELIYDYYGFPEASYQLQYPAPGAPDVAASVSQLLEQHQISHRLDSERGFDHGLFVPLTLLFPRADIPCLQLSLLDSLDPEAHLQLGEAIRQLREDNVLIIGSGFTFHNMRAFFAPETPQSKADNLAFEQWLSDTLCRPDLSEDQRRDRLVNWVSAPGARYCQPREEHLLPLHVCYGSAGCAADQVFSMRVLGKQASCFLWK